MNLPLTNSVLMNLTGRKFSSDPLQEIKNAEASQAEVQTALESGDFLAARQKAQQIISKLQSLQAELQ